jgi:DNA-binding transcriptional ArsR family regulator
VAELLGRSRAALLARLDLPQSTTWLAAHLGLTPSAVSQHLTVLRRAGLVTAHRTGRWVLYRRTTPGTRLLAAAG